MDSQCPWGQRLIKKDDKDSNISSSSGTQSLLTQPTKKDQNNCSRLGGTCRQDQCQGQNTPATGVNSTAIKKKKDKNKKNLANIECYNCK